jgi:DNA-binding MarR family transcriptional regulator
MEAVTSVMRAQQILLGRSNDGLERAGLVTRAPHSGDRRMTLAMSTARGSETAQAATTALHASRFGTEPLNDGELEALTGVLTRVRGSQGDFGGVAET